MKGVIKTYKLEPPALALQQTRLLRRPVKHVRAWHTTDNSMLHELKGARPQPATDRPLQPAEVENWLASGTTIEVSVFDSRRPAW